VFYGENASADTRSMQRQEAKQSCSQHEMRDAFTLDTSHQRKAKT